MFPGAKAYFNIDHIVTKIDKKFYDITGEISNKEFVCNHYMPIGEIYPNNYQTDGSIKDGEMYNPNYKDKYEKKDSKTKQ